MSRTTLYVGRLQRDTRAARIGQEFERYGTLVRCDIPTVNGESKGFGFVEFTHPADAEAAFRAMQGKMIDGRAISIEWAKEPDRGRPPLRHLPIEPPRPSMRDYDPRIRYDDKHDDRHRDIPRHDIGGPLRHDPYPIALPMDRRDDRDRMRMYERLDDRPYAAARPLDSRAYDYGRAPPVPMPPRIVDNRPPRELPRDSRDRSRLSLRDIPPRDPRDSRDPRYSDRHLPPLNNAPPVSRPAERSYDRADRSRSSDISRARAPERSSDRARRSEPLSSSRESGRSEDNKRKSSRDDTRNSRSESKYDDSRKRPKLDEKEPARQEQQQEESEVEEMEIGQQHASQEEAYEYQDEGRDHYRNDQGQEGSS